MIVHKIARLINPMPGFAVVRRVATALLTPLVFSYETGHFQASLRRRAVDKRGQPLPWYTYPAIDFLKHQDLSGKRILEWGAGQSTYWWAQRALSVLSFESDSEWYKRLRSDLPHNVTLLLVPENLVGIDRYLDGQYDLIIVDGFDRYKCAERSVELLARDGAVIVDNSEGYWGPSGQYPIIDLFRSLEFGRVDFYGFCPGVILPHCTSLFFRNSCFLLFNARPPVRSELDDNR